MVYGQGIMDLPRESKSPFYIRWMSMIQRCYDKGSLERDPSYIGVSVCEEWLTFSNFRDWMETKDWEGKCLDKDLKGGSEYSPDTCVFISGDLNRYWTMNRKGISWEEDRQKWRVKIGRKHIGRYGSETEARKVYESCKVEGLKDFLGKESLEVDEVLRSIIYK
jgi:hypothetical protein